jgi:hypothetical protein
MSFGFLNTDNVVNLGPLRQQALFPALSRIESYWEGLRDGRPMPARSEVDPRGIADSLEYAFVLEKIAPGLGRLRLAGMHLGDLMAMEVRGMPLTAMFRPDARRELQKAQETVLGLPAAIRLTLVADGGLGSARLEGQMLLLPLRDDTGAPTRVLGGLQTRGEIGRGPRRFHIRDIETRPLATDPLTTPRPLNVSRNAPAHSDKRDARAHHLRLVHVTDEH